MIQNQNENGEIRDTAKYSNIEKRWTENGWGWRLAQIESFKANESHVSYKARKLAFVEEKIKNEWQFLSLKVNCAKGYKKIERKPNMG